MRQTGDLGLDIKLLVLGLVTPSEPPFHIDFINSELCEGQFTCDYSERKLLHCRVAFTSVHIPQLSELTELSGAELGLSPAV